MRKRGISHEYSPPGILQLVAGFINSQRYSDNKGGVVERFIAPVLKTGDVKSVRGFESHPLRQSFHMPRDNPTKSQPIQDCLFRPKPDCRA